MIRPLLLLHFVRPLYFCLTLTDVNARIMFGSETPLMNNPVQTPDFVINHVRLVCQLHKKPAAVHFTSYSARGGYAAKCLLGTVSLLVILLWLVRCGLSIKYGNVSS